MGEAFLDIGEEDPAVALGELPERSKVLLIDDVLDHGAKGPMTVPAEERETCTRRNRIASRTVGSAREEGAEPSEARGSIAESSEEGISIVR